MNAPPRRLQLVNPGQELSGQVQPELERFLRSVQPRSIVHRGALRALGALCRDGARRILPPSAQGELQLAATKAAAFSTEKERDQLRAQVYGALSSCEGAPARALRASGAILLPGALPAADNFDLAAFERHAEAVCLRYLSLSGHLVVSAHMALLEAWSDPGSALPVVAELAAGRAYQAVALGSLRHAEFRAQVVEQAIWDARRPASVAAGHRAADLAPQILHEFLGAKLRAHAQREQLALEAFLVWALPLHGARTRAGEA